jgi:hypothetical protein
LVIRYWAAIVTALATAALVDWSSELLANAGWLGGIASSDGHQEGVLPIAVLAALVAVGLGITVALRASRGDRIRYRDCSTGTRVWTVLATLAATFAVIALMEAYEMRFGGLSAFDPRSVFAEHWPAVLAGYTVVATIVGRLVTFVLGAAVAAGTLAAHVLVGFLRVDRRRVASAPRHYDSFGTHIPHHPLVLALGSLALRAPPPLRLLYLRQLLT